MTHADEGGKQAEAGENRPVSTGAECNQQAPEEGGAENRHRQVAERSAAPSRGTQLNPSLWTAGIEARHCTYRKERSNLGRFTCGIFPNSFGFFVWLGVVVVVVVVFKKLPPFLLEILKKDGKKRKKKEKERETGREDGSKKE